MIKEEAYHSSKYEWSDSEGLTPDSLALESKTFEFNRYLKNVCKSNNGYYILDDRAYRFLDNFYTDIPLEIYNAGYALKSKAVGIKCMRIKWIMFAIGCVKHQEETLYNLNKEIFKLDGKSMLLVLSAWEMEVMCFYYHDHELKDVNRVRYGLSNFFDIPENPIVETTFKRNGFEIPIYRLHKICGTCIAK